METSKESHWKEGKIILRYMNGTKDFGIMYSTSEDFRLVGYTDNNCGGNTNDRNWYSVMGIKEATYCDSFFS
jgi:hypothetical protein